LLKLFLNTKMWDPSDSREVSELSCNKHGINLWVSSHDGTWVITVQPTAWKALGRGVTGFGALHTQRSCSILANLSGVHRRELAWMKITSAYFQPDETFFPRIIIPRPYCDYSYYALRRLLHTVRAVGSVPRHCTWDLRWTGSGLGQAVCSRNYSADNIIDLTQTLSFSIGIKRYNLGL
jgi:hypothetical protein